MSTGITELPFFDFADPEVAVNPHAALRRVGKEHPIVRTELGIALLDHEDCRAVLRDKRFRTPEGLNLSVQGVTGGRAYDWASATLLGLDGDSHTRVRRLAQPSFTVAAIDRMRPSAAELIAELLDPHVPQGRMEGDSVVDPYSVRMMCKLLGFDESDWQNLSKWADDITLVVSVSAAAQLGRIESALDNVTAYAVRQIEKLRANPRSDSLGKILLDAEDQGDRLTTKELVILCENLLVGGADTTRKSLMLGLLLFTRFPDQWRDLERHPELVESAVEEVLRFRPPFIGTARVAREDVEISGVDVPAGTFITNALCASNFDDKEWDHPDEFDIRRFSDGSRAPSGGHLTFGGGAHFCIGAPLARVEMQEAFRYMCTRMPNLRIDEDDPIGIEWSDPFAIYGPSRLPLAWDA